MLEVVIPFFMEVICGPNTSNHEGLRCTNDFARPSSYHSQPIYNGKHGKYVLLRKEPAEALFQAGKFAHKLGYTIVVTDAYRPTEAQKILLNSSKAKNVPAGEIPLVAPIEDAPHCRGTSVDVYLVKNGKKVSGTHRHHLKNTNTEVVLLAGIMSIVGFMPLENEWWHYNFKDWKTYNILSQNEIGLEIVKTADQITMEESMKVLMNNV